MEQATALERSSSPAISERTHVGESFTKLLWVFLVMSVVGLIGETLQHYLAFNEWESRPGFIWGPFSPIYGTAAVLLTLILEPLQKKNPLVLIAIGAIVGGGLEYFASWAMETFGGIVAWSYLNNPFNFDGRTDLFHALVWGTLGLLWVKIGLPLCEKGFSYLFIAHDLEMVHHISHKIGVMYLGNMVELGSSDDVYKKPLHPYTRALISAAPIADPKMAKEKKRIILEGEVPSPINPPKGCPFAGRCKYATEECKSKKPDTYMYDNRQVACNLYSPKNLAQYKAVGKTVEQIIA